MHRGNVQFICAFASITAETYNYYHYTRTHRLFLIPNSMPVTLSLRYFGAPSYQSLKFIYLQHVQQHQGWIQDITV